jgi:hypothetical protein
MTETWSTIAATLAVPVGFAVFIWWFSTGLILLLDHLPRTGVRWSSVASSAVALAAFVGLNHTADQDSATGAYCAFTSTLLIWGWHELTFLSGWLTGPRRHALADGTRGWPRLKYLQSFFRRRAMNGLFPFVVTASTMVLVLMVQQALAPAASDGTRVGLLLVASLLARAIVEHWLLVLPIESTALWRWALRRQGTPAPAPEPEDTLLHALTTASSSRPAGA